MDILWWWLVFLSIDLFKKYKTFERGLQEPDYNDKYVIIGIDRDNDR